MKSRVFRGSADLIENAMNEFFDEVGHITIKHLQMVSTNIQDDIQEPVVVILLLYEEK